MQGKGMYIYKSAFVVKTTSSEQLNLFTTATHSVHWHFSQSSQSSLQKDVLHEVSGVALSLKQKPVHLELDVMHQVDVHNYID